MVICDQSCASVFLGFYLTLSYGTVGSFVITSLPSHICIDMYRTACWNSPLRRSLRSHKTNKQTDFPFLSLSCYDHGRWGILFLFDYPCWLLKSKAWYVSTHGHLKTWGFFLVSKMLLANYPFAVYGFNFLGKYIGVRDGGEGRERTFFVNPLQETTTINPPSAAVLFFKYTITF